MADIRDIKIQPGEVGDVIKQLDELAGRVDAVLKTESPHLTTVAPGSDEVSQRVARTSNAVHESFGKAAALGSTEIREVAATLRAHSGKIQETDLA
ncbi:PE domain-containing protein [Mycobacteroides abscessus subsp. massiliense]|uniref:PE family protein n=1 Tax=Mycobacteroides abscessus TaxID=36809 RepID=UPI00266D021F|nr:PE domain-containing protein [Mycobacteroides abscessus]MDO3300433.1 PE domain-containing protein [Mycobacteroides abscessus subsp. massiliense]